MAGDVAELVLMTAPVQRLTIPAGDAGARQTLRIMRRLVRQSLAVPIVRAAITSITTFAGSRDVPEQALRIKRFLEDHIRFLPDPIGVELLHTPEWMLREIQRKGIIAVDCDDAAVLGAALAMNAGIRPVFVAESYFFPGSPFQHVYTELPTPAGVVSLDVTKPYQTTAGAPVSRRFRMEA